jgi:hypothetical protein
MSSAYTNSDIFIDLIFQLPILYLNLHVLIRLNTKKWFWYAACLHVFIWMYAWLCALWRLNGRTDFIHTRHSRVYSLHVGLR